MTSLTSPLAFLSVGGERFCFLSHRIGKQGILHYLEAETSERGSKFTRIFISVKESMLLFLVVLFWGILLYLV